jgi:hypothetical protein
MDVSFQLLSHTRHLLQNGIFNHLSDQKISTLHYIILSASNKVQDQQAIFKLWREGDYTSNFTSMQFLQQTNYLLQMHGQRMIEEDFLELILD